MNNITSVIEGNEMDYIAMTGWGLFVISEVMPFLKKKERFNGLIHTLTCMLRGSKCFIDNALVIAESNIKTGEEKTGVISH